MNKAIRLAVFIILISGNEIASAQNPLRAGNTGQLPEQRIEYVQKIETSPAADASLTRYQESQMFLGTIGNDANAIPARVDMNVAPVSYEQIPRPQVKQPEWDNSSSCLLYTSPSPRDQRGSRMPSSA